MWCMLVAAVLYPLIDAGELKSRSIPESLANPVIPVVISDAQLREQADLYRLIPDPSVRSQIALVLRKSNNPAARNFVMDLLLKEKTIALQADLLITLHTVLKQTKEPLPAPERLSVFLQSDSPIVRKEAARLMIEAKTGLPEIEAMLKRDTSPEVVDTVLSCLAGTDMHLSAETVSLLASSSVTAIRDSAVCYLAQTSENPDREKILSEAFIRAEKDELARFSLVKGLAANTGRRFPKMLKKLISPDTCSVAIRVEAASMPGTTSDRSDFLKQLLDDPSASVRATAANSLQYAEHTVSLEKALGRRLNDESESVRENSAKALAKMVKKELSRDVLDMVSDRRAFAPILIVIRATGNKKYAPVVTQIMNFGKKEKDSRLLKLSIEALAAMRAEAMTPLILDCAAYPSIEVRVAVAQNLCVFPGSATTVTLKKLVRDPSESVAIAAMETIRVLADPEFVPELSEAIGKFGKTAIFRATACVSFLGMPEKLDAAALKNLEKMILTQCIAVPMGQPTYDDPLPRAMGFLLLLKSSQSGNMLSRELFTKTVDRLQNPTEQEKNDGICNGFMAEYVRQILLIKDGKTVIPEKIPALSPDFRIEKIHIK